MCIVIGRTEVFKRYFFCNITNVKTFYQATSYTTLCNYMAFIYSFSDRIYMVDY